MRTAIFIDGAFFIKRVRHFYKDKNITYNAKEMADLAFSMAVSHLSDKNKRKDDELYRIFFYDCPPLSKKMHNPISKKAIDWSKSDEATFRSQLHKELVKKRKFALRLGKLSETQARWKLKPAIEEKLLKNKMSWCDVQDSDITIDVTQKGVDMRIGIDITSVVLKQQAKRIILISGDSDFVPVSKLARREGADFILDPMWQQIPEDLFEHIDGLRSTFRRNQGEVYKG